jgi:hypothetical protein
LEKNRCGRASVFIFIKQRKKSNNLVRLRD